MATTTKVLTIPLENTPGTLGEAARILANEKVNVVAVESTSLGDFGYARFVTDQPEKAEKALRTRGYPVSTGEFIETEVPNRPGELARICEALGKADVNIEGLWGGPATKDTGRILLRVNDPVKARTILQATTPQTVSR